MRTKLSTMLEGLTDLNETELEKDIATQMEEFTEKAMPTLAEARDASPAPEHVATFKDYAETAQNLRKSLRMSMYHRGKRGQANLTDTQAEALDRIIEGVAMILTYDPTDVTWWNAINNNADLGKG